MDEIKSCPTKSEPDKGLLEDHIRKKKQSIGKPEPSSTQKTEKPQLSKTIKTNDNPIVVKIKKSPTSKTNDKMVLVKPKNVNKNHKNIISFDT